MKRILALWLAVCCVVSAAEQTVRWPELGPVISGRKVVIRLQDGSRVKGASARVEPEAVIVQTKSGEKSVPRPSVREIVVAKRSGYKWRIIGMALGAGVGAAIAIPVLTETHNEGSGTYDGAAAGLILGLAALGYVGGWSTDRSGDVIHVLPQ